MSSLPPDILSKQLSLKSKGRDFKGTAKELVKLELPSSWLEVNKDRRKLYPFITRAS